MYEPYSDTMLFSSKKMTQEFPGCPVVRTPHFHRQGSGFNPWSGN